jgi:integrase
VAQNMPQPWKHPKSGVYYYRKAVPKHLRATLGRGEFRISLGTKDLREAKLLYPATAAKVDALIAQAGGGPTILDHQQIYALAGLWYQRELEATEANPEEPENYSIYLDHLQDADERGKGREAVSADVDAIRKSGEVWYLDINEEDEGKALKNPGSARKVPLHPVLITEGFPEYVASVPKDGLLFPDLKADGYGKLGEKWGKWYTRWLRLKLGITDPRLVAHSGRHRFKDLCRNASIEKSIHDALTGHSSSDEGDKYGMGFALPVLAAAIAKLETPS